MSLMSAMMAVPVFEKDYPFAPSFVFPLMVFDTPLDMAQLRERLRQRLFLFERFRSRAVKLGDATSEVESYAFELLPIDSIDMEYHVCTLEHIRTEEQMFEYMNEVWTESLDLDRPLWRWVYLNNCQDGRYRLLGVFDHSVGDGHTMVKTLLSLLDDDSSATADTPNMTPPPRRAPPSVPFLTRMHATCYGLLAPFLVKRLADTTTCLRSPDGQWSGTRKSFAHPEPIELQRVKEVKERFPGATVNDIMMATLTLSVKRFLEMRHGSSVGARVSATFPINRRAAGAQEKLDESTFGNKILIGRWPFDFSFKDRIECVWQTKDTAAWVKCSPQPYIEWLLQSFIMPRLSLSSIKKLTETHASTMPSAMLTNVPGPQQPVVFLGQEVAEMRFHAVTSAFGLMYQIFSYKGKITATINVDPRVGDAEELAKLWKSEFEALYADVMSSCVLMEERRPRRQLRLTSPTGMFVGAAFVALVGIAAVRSWRILGRAA